MTATENMIGNIITYDKSDLKCHGMIPINFPVKFSINILWLSFFGKYNHKKIKFFFLCAQVKKKNVEKSQLYLKP